jgi:hypothetical protein
MALVFVPRHSSNPIQDYEIKQMLAEYDPTSYTPLFPSRSESDATAPEESNR